MWASAPTAVGRSTSVERGWSCVARHIRRIDPCIWSGQRQRRGRRDDPTFHAPCKIHQPCGTHPNNLKRAGRAKGFLNRRFKRRFLHTFCRCWQKVCRRRHQRPLHPPGYGAKRSRTSAHINHIHILIPVFGDVVLPPGEVVAEEKVKHARRLLDVCGHDLHQPPRLRVHRRRATSSPGRSHRDPSSAGC